MNSAIELHDSECLALELDSSANASLTLDAYVHRSDGVPCETPGKGGNQRVRFYIKSASVSGEIGALPATIYEGSLVVGNSNLDLVPLPLEVAEVCELRLVLSDDARHICIMGRALRVIPEGDFHFVEHVDFSDIH